MKSMVSIGSTDAEVEDGVHSLEPEVDAEVARNDGHQQRRGVEEVVATLGRGLVEGWWWPAITIVNAGWGDAFVDTAAAQ